MIVVEGPDGGGKTTLVEQLQGLTGFRLMPRRVGTDTQALVDLEDWVQQDNKTGEDNLLYDRHALISEPIYGPILRYQQKPCFTDVKWLTRQLQDFYLRRPLVIYCLPPLGVVKKNIESDPDNAAVAHKIDAIYAAYAYRASLDKARASISSFTFDYTIHTPQTIIGMWQFYIEEFRFHASR